MSYSAAERGTLERAASILAARHHTVSQQITMALQDDDEDAYERLCSEDE